MSLARPFDDLCRRDHVFLVVVVFEFEFVVCRPGVLNQVSTVRTLLRSIDAYSTVLRRSNNLRTVETAGVWIQGHNRRTSSELLVGTYVCWGPRRGILVWERNDRDLGGS